MATDAVGNYTISNLPAGTYDVKVSAQGLKSYVKSGVPVIINTVARVDATLELGALTETVQVNASAQLLQTDRADVHSDLTATTLENVPLAPGNNFEYLFGTIPGVNPPETAHSIPTNPSRALQFNVNGTSEYGNDVRIDGVSQFNIWVPENAAYIPSSDAIQTVNMVTNNFNPEQGLAGGSTINVQIKSGTNQIHGDAYEYHFDNKLEAHNFFDPNNKITRVPKDIFNQFGGSVGGPIKKDKLFYFGNVEVTRQRQFATRVDTVPTLAMMAGDLRGNDPMNGLANNADVVYDPTTGGSGSLLGSNRMQIYATNNPADTVHYNALCASARCDNVIPTSRISPVALKLLGLLQQAPGRYLPSASTKEPNDNYISSGPFAFNRFTTDEKIDWNVSKKFTMYGHIGFLRYNDLDPPAFGGVGGYPISSYGGNSGHGFGHTITFTVTGNYAASPHFVVDGNFGLTRMVTDSEQLDLNKNQGPDVLGLPGTNGTRRFEGSWPRFHFGNTYLGTQEHYMPYIRNDPQFYWSSNASWIRGSHMLRFGGSVFVLRLNHQQAEWNAGGSDEPAAGGFEFGSSVTQCSNCLNGKSSLTNYYNNFAAFLMGIDTAYGKNILIPDSFRTNTRQFALYVGDQWQATRKLTTTLGLRWEYFPMPTRGGSRGLERYDFATNQMMICGLGGIPTDCGVSVSKREFAPRVGLAYRLRPTFVIRGGYGITNEPFNLADAERTNYPVLVPLYSSAVNYGAAGAVDTVSQQNAPPGETLPIGIVIPVLPDFSKGEVPIPGNVNLVTSPSNLQRGYIQSWNFTLEKELPHGWLAQAGYVATRSTKQLGYIDLNAETPIGPAGCIVGSSGATECGDHKSQPLNFNYAICPKDLGTTLAGCRQGATSLVTPAGTNHYDALQTRLEHRFAAGYEVQLAYTWSKTIGIAGYQNEKGHAYIQTPAFYYLNRGLAPQDRPHNFTATFIAQSPFGPGRRWTTSGWGAKALGGWQLSGTMRKVSGRVFQIHAGGPSSTNLNATVGNTQRPDLVNPAVGVLSQYGPGTTWFDTTAFAPVTDNNRFGTSPFYLLHGPPMFNVDLGLGRNFKFSERITFQLRAQAFNFTNTPHFNNPNGDLNSSAFGRVNGLANVGRDGGRDARQYELAAKLSF